MRPAAINPVMHARSTLFTKEVWWAALDLAAAAPLGALGQAGPDFYANKQIRMIIGYPPGDDYDLAARFLAVKTRHDRCLKMCAYPGAKAGAAYIRI
jgi:tripartite-type tricarboxylate transporter receptor subunit TctC